MVRWRDRALAIGLIENSTSILHLSLAKLLSAAVLPAARCQFIRFATLQTRTFCQHLAILPTVGGCILFSDRDDGL